MPEGAARARAAMLKLIWLTLYVTLMRLLGYRIRRDRTPPAAPAAPASPRPIQSAPRRPRQKHRYLDRDMALAMLADINAALTPAGAEPRAIPSQPARATRTIHRSPAPHRAPAVRTAAASYHTQIPTRPQRENSILWARA
jgi:hypothetical protein